MIKRTQNPEHRTRFTVFGLIIAAFLVFTAAFGCTGLRDAHKIKKAPMPPKYVESRQAHQIHQKRETHLSEGSLWAVERVSFFEDRKARRVNDLVMILINERTGRLL